MKEQSRTYEIPPGKIEGLKDLLKEKGYRLLDEKRGAIYIFSEERENTIGTIHESASNITVISPEQERVIGENLCNLLTELELS